MTRNLNQVENVFYFSYWIFMCLYSIYKLVEAQTDIFEKYPGLRHELEDLIPGWKFTSRLKDESDMEWAAWKYSFRKSWFYMLIQFFISEILRQTNTSLLKYWYIMSSVIFISTYMGLKQLLIILTQPLIFSVIIYSGGKRISIWLASILILACFNSLKYKYYLWNIFDSTFDIEEEIHLILFASGWTELRCISFCLEYVDKTEKISAVHDKTTDKTTVGRLSIYENVLNMCSYVLYLPVLFMGPVILYEEFERSFHVKNENLLLRIKSFIRDMMLYQIYTFILDLSLHYIYWYAMQSQIWIIKELPSIALCGGGVFMGLEFLMKYVISFGTTTAFSRLDNIDTPPTPRCIARIHVYSKMWRYFDVGLYRFLLKYIYMPVFNMLSNDMKISKLPNKLFSSLMTFVFIFLWHGIAMHIFTWSLLNYIGIAVETMGKTICETDQYKWFKARVLKTKAMEVRFHAFLCAPLLYISSVSGFHLFGGVEVANLYFGLLKWSHTTIILYFTLYCVCQVSIALENVPSRTDFKKVENKTVK